MRVGLSGGSEGAAADEARKFALRSLDRVLSEAWRPAEGLLHVFAYSDPKASQARGAGIAR